MPVLTLIVRNGRGETIAELALDERAARAPERHERSPNEYAITDAQRRTIYRMVARLGLEGDHAREYVDRRLGPDPDRRAASRLIDELQNEAKRGNGGRDVGAP